jgi:Zn-dependent protease with chaperone function
MENQQSQEPIPETDPHALARAQERQQMLAAGMLALPNLFLRSALTLTLLYSMLGVVLIGLVQFGLVNTTVAVIFGCGIVLLQFIVGPWIMDLMLRFLYKMSWVQAEELPEHLEAFVSRVCQEHGMRFPWFGIIDDGAPQAFTYGHHPSNARVVISRGLFELLAPEEVEAVVAHELGHARNWDMALMTLANLVPLLLFWLYDTACRIAAGGDNKENKVSGAAWVVAIGAYVLYIVSQYIVLWFSRTREYYADRFAGRVTGKPNALASALVKIAYGLAAADSKEHARAAAGKEAKKSEQVRASGVSALGALNIFDRGAAVNMVMCAAPRTDHGKASAGQVDVERVKSAMQWDLWNPWATFYELNSTHPLVAKRLLRLSDQASVGGQQPYVMFDRAKPESYWDDFLVDFCVLALPWLGLLAGLGLFAGMSWAAQDFQWHWLGVAVGLLGLGAFVRNRFAYRGKIFEHRTVASLMSHVKVSPVRPVPTTMTGTIIGKGVPGLIWSEDFVIRDQTGILFLDYRQPLAIWNWLFGLLRAGRYQGKEVRVQGWFRRAPTPYLEIYHMDVVDGSEASRTCYSYYANVIGCVLLAAIGFGAAAVLVSMGL